MEPETQRRRTPRFPFSAPAEITHASKVYESLVTELSLYGCYLKTCIPAQCGSRVMIRITSAGQFFEASASVLYSGPLLGTGVVFREVKPPFHAVLQEWMQQSLDDQDIGLSITSFESDKNRERPTNSHGSAI
jgi:hypothetical protein